MPQPFGVGPFEVRAIGSHGPIAGAILDLRRRHLGWSPFRYGGSQLGGVDIERAYIYPVIAATKQTDGQVLGAK